MSFSASPPARCPGIGREVHPPSAAPEAARVGAEGSERAILCPDLPEVSDTAMMKGGDKDPQRKPKTSLSLSSKGDEWFFSIIFKERRRFA